MAGPNKFGPPCGCCECPQVIVVNVRCNRCGGGISPISGASVTLKDSGGVTITTGTTDATGGWSYSSVLSAGTYTVDIAATGYTPNPASETFSVACNQTKSVTFTLCPNTLNFLVDAFYECDCPAEGASVTLGGDITGSGTIGADGRATIAVTRPVGVSCCDTIEWDATITPTAAGYSAVTIEGGDRNGFLPATWSAGCSGGYVLARYATALMADPGSAAGRCPYIWPASLSYSDSYGSCTLDLIIDSCGTASYVGTYTYSSTNAATQTKCGGGPVDP